MKNANSQTISRNYYLSLSILMISLFILLHPKLNVNLPIVRHFRLNSFINHSIKTASINMQDYWQFQESYSPGLHEIYTSPLFKTHQSDYKSVFQASIPAICQPSIYSHYHSPHILTDSYFINQNCQFFYPPPDNSTELLKSSTDQIIKTSQFYLLLNTKTLDEAITFHGFLSFDLTEPSFARPHQSLKLLTISQISTN